ncbi:MAG: PspA/IM30 family protein [Deltaproteobacteria bacterium]|nr:PspA/IM30 family protein [Deltaproteobacteria bacterium]
MRSAAIFDTVSLGNYKARLRSEDAVADGFFARVGNLWKGFLSLWISNVEKEHPEIAYENAINSMVAKYTQLKKATAAIIRRREDITSRLDKAKKDLAQIERDLSAAVQTDQKDLGVVLIQKKQGMAQDVTEMEAELLQANTDAETAKASLMQVQGEINKLKAEKDRMLAKLASAQARVKINEQLDGLSVDAEVKALDNVREHIKTTMAEAKLGDELRENDLDTKLAKLRAASGDATANEEWEKLKTQGAAKTQRTMG